jgi:hypothetical protein
LAEAYEILRSQALHPEECQNLDSDRVVLIRQGMAAWIRRIENPGRSSSPKQKPVFVSSRSSPSQLVEEVAGLMAEIIIKSERFIAHA